MTPLWTIIKRDVLCAVHSRQLIYQTVIFQLLAVVLFPLGLGTESQILREIAPAIIWILPILASQLTLTHIFNNDYRNGTLEVYCLTQTPLPIITIAKILAHWVYCGLPLVIFSPIIALLLHLPTHAYPTMLLTLLLGTFIMSTTSSLGSAISLQSNHGGLVNLILVTPLLTPALIVGANAIQTKIAGYSVQPHLMILAGISLLCITLIPMWVSMIIHTHLE